MLGSSAQIRRSGCPVNAALEIFGDRWSLLIVRDMMVRGYRTFGEFLAAGEGIATNILADRLRRLEAAGLLMVEPMAGNRRGRAYRLTEKGVALAPAMLELLIWAARHEDTAVPCAVIDHLESNRAEVLAETRRRWEVRDPTPLIPPFRPRPSRKASSRRRKAKKA